MTFEFINVKFPTMFENLKQVSIIKPGDKLYILEGQIICYTPGVFDSLGRTYSKDSRAKSLEMIEMNIRECLFILQLVMESIYIEITDWSTGKKDNLDYCIQLKGERTKLQEELMIILNDVSKGLENLGITYKGDKQTVDRINKIKESIDGDLFKHAAHIFDTQGNIEMGEGHIRDFM